MKISNNQDIQLLINKTVDNDSPIIIEGKTHKAVLISSSKWDSIQETLYLLSIPNMRDEIIEGIKTPLAECSDDLDW